MDLSIYIFAFYVFLLVCGAIWFFSRMTGTGKKKDKSSFEKEQRLFKLYQNVEDMLSSFEEYAEEARVDIDERLKEAEALIKGTKGSAEPKPMRKSTAESTSKTAPAKSAGGQKTRESNQDTPDRQKLEEMIPKYLEKGMNSEEIARALGISSREVSLMMEIKNIKIPGDKN